VNASTDEIAVIQTRLPYTDRRALSEAWFSALRCVSENIQGEEMRRVAPPAAFRHVLSRQQRWHAVSAEKNTYPASAERASRSKRDAVAARGGYEAESAIVRKSLALRGESSEASREKSAHVLFTMTVAGARAALHIRQVGDRMIVIAVCSARHVEAVRRALTDAATGMRSRGTYL